MSQPIDGIVDPPAKRWKVGDVVTVTDSDGITRCRVTDITVYVDENGEPYRSVKLDEVTDED